MARTRILTEQLSGLSICARWGGKEEWSRIDCCRTNKDRSLAGSSQHIVRRSHPWPRTRCGASDIGRSSEALSLSDIGAKSLQSKTLSLNEQVELERQLEEAQEKDFSANTSVARSDEEENLGKSGSARWPVAGDGGAADANVAPKTTSGVSESWDSESEGSSAQSGWGEGVAGGQYKRAAVALSQVAETGLGGNVLSLSEQVELERLAEEKLSQNAAEGLESKLQGDEGTMSNTESWGANDEGALNLKQDRWEGASMPESSLDRQAEVESTLEQTLQQVLEEQGLSNVALDKELVLKNGPSDSRGGNGLDREDTLPEPQATPGKVSEPIKVSLVRVDLPETEDALAMVRAQVFYTYPDDRTMTAAQRVTARSELRKKLKENVQEEKGIIDLMRALKRPEHAFLAMCDRPYYDSLLSSKASVPSEKASGEPDPYLKDILQPATLTRTETVVDKLGSFEIEQVMAVVGTFAIEVGPKLTGQYLVGAKPLEVERQAIERGYLYSICVLPTIQRRGLGLKLVEEAKSFAKRMGVRHLYVHVELSNIGAEKLYTKAGFVVEQVESEESAKRLKRPRRKILWCGLENHNTS